jgi:RNA polymerase sigma factor (sigma-70 family)
MTGAPKKQKTKVKAKSAPQACDSELIEQCLKGKESAWIALVEKYKNLIFSIPVRYGFAQEDSADIFQAVCMDLLADLARLRDPAALAGWLIQVTRNKCFQRKQAMVRSKVQELGDLEPPAPLTEPENLIFQAQQEQLLRNALNQLPVQCQELVKMLFFETPPRPYEQIAKQLRLARGSIGFVRRNCLDKLKEQLEDLDWQSPRR